MIFTSFWFCYFFSQVSSFEIVGLREDFIFLGFWIDELLVSSISLKKKKLIWTAELNFHCLKYLKWWKTLQAVCKIVQLIQSICKVSKTITATGSRGLVVYNVTNFLWLNNVYDIQVVFHRLITSLVD